MFTKLKNKSWFKLIIIFIVIFSLSISIKTQAAVPPATVYEDAENGDIEGWHIFDNDPAGANIVNVFDAGRGSRVIELQGSGLSNGFQLSHEVLDINGNVIPRPGWLPLDIQWGVPWYNDMQYKVKWSMKTTEDYVIYFNVYTSDNRDPYKHIWYDASDSDFLGSGDVHHGLGNSSKNGTWHTFERDLLADLKEAQPNIDIADVRSLYVRGNGLRLDDVKLDFRPEEAAVFNTSSVGWGYDSGWVDMNEDGFSGPSVVQCINGSASIPNPPCRGWRGDNNCSGVHISYQATIDLNLNMPFASSNDCELMMNNFYTMNSSLEGTQPDENVSIVVEGIPSGFLMDPGEGRHQVTAPEKFSFRRGWNLVQFRTPGFCSYGSSVSFGYSVSRNMVDVGRQGVRVRCNPTAAALILDISAVSPINSGQTTTVTWSSQNATTCTPITGDAGWIALAGSMPLSGNYVSGSLNRDTIFTMRCENANDAVTKNVVIFINDDSSPQLSFTANPEVIDLGGSSSLDWTTSNVVRCWGSTASGGDPNWLDGWVADLPNGNKSVLPKNNIVYYMECWDKSGQSTGKKSAQVSVRVTNPGVCGSDHDGNSCSKPGNDLCAVGVPTVVIYNETNNKWEWQCKPDANCSANKKCFWKEIAP